MLAAEKRAVEIDRQNLPPRGEIGLLDVAQRREARRVDQAIEPVVRAADLGDHAEPVRLGGDVERVVCAVAAGQIAGDRKPAGGVDRLRHGLAERAGGAGDQNDLVLEPLHPASAALVIVRVVVIVVMIVVIVMVMVIDDRGHDHDRGDDDRPPGAA